MHLIPHPPESCFTSVLILFCFFDLPTTHTAPKSSTHINFSASLLLYSALSRYCPSLGFQHILWSPSVPAAFWQPTPLITVEGGTDGNVFEDVMSAEEVHSKGQIIRSHPFQLCCTQTRTPFQLSETSLFWGTLESKERHP